MRWVIEEARVPGHLFAVLACLAWKADDLGRGAYPSEVTLAEWTGKSERQVRSDLKALAATTLTGPGDPSLVAHLRADRRPAVWDLAMPARLPDHATGGSTRPVVSFRARPCTRGSTASPRAEAHFRQ